MKNLSLALDLHLFLGMGHGVGWFSKGNQTSIFIFSFFIASMAWASGPISRCAERVEELARLHVMMDQNPGLAVRDLLNAENGTAMAGVLTTAYMTRPLVPGDLERSRRLAELRRQRAPLRRELQTILRGAAPRIDNINGPYFFDQFNVRATQGPWGLSPRPQNVVVDDAIQRINEMARTEGRSLTLAEQNRLREVLPRYFETSGQISELRSQNNRAFFSKARIRTPMRGARIGAAGVIGFMMGQQINSIISHAACREFGVGNLVGYFQTSLPQYATEESPCYLNTEGAITMANNPDQVGQWCEQYPKLPEALAHSLNYYGRTLGENAQGKSELSQNQNLQCTPAGGRMSIEVAGIPMDLVFNDERTQIDFTMTGSQAGPNRGEVIFHDNQPPEFVNSWGARLSQQSETAVDLRSLSYYYLNSQSVPSLNPSQVRRYLMGAGVVFANMYRENYLTRCYGRSTSEPLQQAEVSP